MKATKRLVRLGAAVCAMAFALAGLAGCSPSQPYEPPALEPKVASPAVIEDGVLHVGVNTENAPLAGQPTSSMRIVGIDVDVAAALADKLGLKLDVVDVGADFETALNDGTVDIVMGVDKAEAGSFWTSDTYLPTAVALFAMDGANDVPPADTDATIAAQVSSKSAWAVSSEYEGATLDATEDLHTAFEKLSKGEVAYVAADAIIGTYAAHSAGVEAHIVALMQAPSGYAVGCLDGNTELKQAVGDTVASLMSEGIVNVIQTKWLGAPLELSSVPLTPSAAASAEAAGESAADDGSGGEAAAEGEAAEGGEAAAEGEAAADGEAAAPEEAPAEGAADAEPVAA